MKRIASLVALSLLACSFLASNAAVPAVGERDTIVASKGGAGLDAYLERCELFGFSGSVLVTRKGAVLLRKGYGLARPDEGVPNTPETLFDIASASKQVTAAAILKLESMGKLKTSDSIAKHLADVPEEHEEVTIQHLLNHTAGWARSSRAGNGDDRDVAVATYLAAKRIRKAGAQHEYYNGGYALLAAIVERVTDKRYEDWVQANLFAPAKLQHTTFMDTADVSDPLLAKSHDSGKLTTDYIHGWGYKGMGGVVTSVSDLQLWIEALHSGKVLPKKALEKLFTPALENYACGWYVLKTSKGNSCISHGGAAPGFESYIRHFPDKEVLILLMSNREGTSWQVTWGLSSLLLDEDPQVPLPPVTVTWSDEKLDGFVGTYTSEDCGSFVVERSGGAIRLGAEGQGSIALLSGDLPSKGSNFEWERGRAAAIIAGLLAGSVEQLEQDMLPHIPKAWPGQVLSMHWPNHIKEHGTISSFEEIGAKLDARTKRTRVWVRLQHPDHATAVEIAFVDRKLNIFDLKVERFPAEASFAPIGENRLTTYDFTAESMPEITLGTKSDGSATLNFELGKKSFEFVRPQP